MPVISGNVGGSSGSGAQVHIRNKNNTFSTVVVCNGSGDYTVTVADHDTYSLRASIAASVIRGSRDVVVNGSDVTAVNFTISAINSAN